MRDGWELVRLGDVVVPDLDRVAVVSDTQYQLAGVYSFGRGLFRREPILGSGTSYKQLNVLHADHLVLSKLKAWEGAVTVISQDFEGCVLSPEFPTYVVERGRLMPEYLTLLCTHRPFWELLATKSTGMGGRKERVHHLRVLDVEFVIPLLAEQRRIVDLIGAVDDVARSTHAAIRSFRDAARTTSLELIRWESPDTPLGDVASIESKLVTPTAEEYRDLLHVGIEKIVSGTGELLPLATAASDGVTSGKHLFTEEDVIYSKIRPELQKAVLPGFVGLCSADAYPLRAGDRILKEYLFELVLSEGFSQRSISKSGRTKMPKINRNELFSIQIEVPSIAEQGRVAHVLGVLRENLTALRNVSDSVKMVRRALLSDLLSGNREIPASYDSLLEMAS
jgi:type I restriction enzyme S subunit